MRIRSTKPEFWRSATIAALPWDVRLVLKGLESYVDDNGVGKDDIALIAGDVFQRDLVANAPETLARLSEAVTTLDQHRLIVRYEVDGEKLIYIDRWKQHQRIDKPAKGRFRRPDGTLEYADDVNRDSYPSPPETLARVPEVLAPGTGEQGISRTGDQGNRPVPTTSDIVEADVDEANFAVVVTAYVDGAKGAGLPRPSERLRGKVGRDAKRLATKEGVPLPALVAAARSLGERGWDDIDRELQRVAVNGRPQQSHNSQVLHAAMSAAQQRAIGS